MNFQLSTEQQEARALFRAFAEHEVKPLAGTLDEEERFPRETVEKMSANGLWGLTLPSEYGGRGADALTYILCIEEIARVCASTATIFSAHLSLCADPIRLHGTPQQKEKYLSKIGKEGAIGAFSLTEPNAGSDVSGLETQAVRGGDHYILNGHKIFITNGGEADFYLLFALTDPARGTRGISAFIVEKDFPGLTADKKEKKMGIRGSATAGLFLKDCPVPKENLLGAEGKGFSIAMGTLDGGRVGIGALALGIAQGALDETLAYVRERRQFGQPIADFQNTQFRLADMSAQVEAARLLVYQGALAKDGPARYSREAALAKLFASQTAMAVTTQCVQLLGGYGYLRDYGLERMMRDAKITEIYEGTNEIQRMVLASALLK